MYNHPIPPHPTPEPWHIRDTIFQWGYRTYVMGVLNVTPDSFSDGGKYHSLPSALTHAHRLVAAGADLLDVGGQSTRPGAVTISLEEELERVIPIIQAIRQGTNEFSPLSIPISVDTTRVAVAQAAIAAGADMVNDISAATFEAEMLTAIAQLAVPLILMHIRGTPQTMQHLTDYPDLINHIYDFMAERIEAAIVHGIPKARLMMDPGIGFAKTYDQNIQILQHLPQFISLGCAILVGPSRKSFIGHFLNQPHPNDRIWGTATACCAAIAGGAHMVRVHDVWEMVQVCRMADIIWKSKPDAMEASPSVGI